MNAFALWALVSSPIGRLLIGGLVAAVTLGSSYLYLRVHYYNEGWNAALHAVAAQDERANNAADKAKETVRACRIAGGEWDVPSGMCKRL